MGSGGLAGEVVDDGGVAETEGGVEGCPVQPAARMSARTSGIPFLFKVSV